MSNSDIYNIIKPLVEQTFESYMDNNHIAADYKKTWGPYNDQYMDSLSKYLEIKWPNSCTKIVASVGLVPVCSRNINERTFLIHPKEDERVIETCMHESCHFLFFEKCKELFSNLESSDFDNPSLLWYLSEIAVDPILNSRDFQSQFVYKFRCYESFYDVYIGNENLVGTIRKIFTENNISDAIKYSYQYMTEHEVCIREQCNDNILRKNQDLYFCTNRNIEYKSVVDQEISKSKLEALSFFECGSIKEPTFNVYIYDSILLLRKGLRKRGFTEYPEYMCAAYNDLDNSLNLFEPIDEYSKNDWNKEEYKQVIFHEVVHGTQKYLFEEQPEWLTEGIAGLIANQYPGGIQSLMTNSIKKYNIPNIKLLQGDTFVTDEYDGYDLSFMAISYLIESRGKQEFLGILKDKEMIAEVEKDVLTKDVEYYSDLYKNDSTR